MVDEAGDQCNAAGPDIVPPAAGVLPSGQASIAECDSTIVFCGDAQQVSHGFALALNAMESNADALMMGIEPVRARCLHSLRCSATRRSIKSSNTSEN